MSFHQSSAFEDRSTTESSHDSASDRSGCSPGPALLSREILLSATANLPKSRSESCLSNFEGPVTMFKHSGSKTPFMMEDGMQRDWPMDNSSQDEVMDEVVTGVRNVTLGDVDEPNVFTSDPDDSTTYSDERDDEEDILESKEISHSFASSHLTAGTLMMTDDDEARSRANLEYIREKFMNSSWFLKVDQILSDNLLQNSLVRNVGRPAEFFYNTAMDAYLSTNKFQDFIEALKFKLGGAWDERLTHPATVFFTTARAASAILGAGRFIGGAIQLGRSTLSQVIQGFLFGWEQVLKGSDNAVDYLLPEFDAEIRADLERKASEDSAASQRPAPVISSAVSVSSSTGSHDHSPESSAKKRPRGVTDIIDKVGRRVRQRLPTFEGIKSLLKEKLTRSSWFQKVDEILMQNVLVKSFGDLMRPAEHFFETAMSTFKENKWTMDEFIQALKTRLGGAWDDRLVEPACEFYESATEASDIEITEEAFKRRNAMKSSKCKTKHN